MSVCPTAPECACMNACISRHCLAHTCSQNRASFHTWVKVGRRHDESQTLPDSHPNSHSLSFTPQQRLKVRSICPKVIVWLQSVRAFPKSPLSSSLQDPEFIPITAFSGGRNGLSPVTCSKNKGNCRSGVGGAGWGVLPVGASAGHERSHSTPWAVPTGDQASKFPARLASRNPTVGATPGLPLAFICQSHVCFPLGWSNIRSGQMSQLLEH